MFSKAKRICRNGAAINSDELFSRVLSQSTVENKMIAINQEQLSEGKRADGSLLPDYSTVSVEVFGKTPGPMTLKDTGDFYSSMHVEVQPDSAIVSDSDWKTQKLQSKYGKNILGIKEKQNELIPFIKPLLMKEVKAKLSIR